MTLSRLEPGFESPWGRQGNLRKAVSGGFLFSGPLLGPALLGNRNDADRSVLNASLGNHRFR